MTDSARSVHQKWASFRFAVVGQLIGNPPPRGELRPAIEKLSKCEWKHPIVEGETIRFGFSTIEAWFYQAKKAINPIDSLRRGIRTDAGDFRTLCEKLADTITRQYRDYPDWTYELHHSNIEALVKENPQFGPIPSYSTFKRYMKAKGFRRLPRRGNAKRPGVIKAQERMEKREVRSFEVDHIGGLLHLDFHTPKTIGVVKSNGDWVKPPLLAVMDDRSRLCCHAQFYFDEDTETLVHGFSQSLLKRGLPRALLTDNGGPMVSAEFKQGLESLSITHETTLPYSPAQNGKQEHFWAVVESRFLPLLAKKQDLTIHELNQYLQAWVDGDHNRRYHREIKETPQDRFHCGPSVLRECPSPEVIRKAFRQHTSRKVRRSDATLTILGTRYELPAAYRHFERIIVAFARWDMSFVHLLDKRTGKCIARIWPLDRSRNASGQRRVLEAFEGEELSTHLPTLPPKLRQLLEEQAEFGLPRYLSKGENPDES